MRKFTTELKIGLFILLAASAAVLFWTRTQNFASETYTLKTNFNYVGGIKENSIVTLSGYEVGRVTAVNFIYEPETKVEIVMSIANKAKIRTDSIAYIGSAGFIGDAFIGLTPGSSGTAFVEPGATVVSEDPIEMRTLMKKADSIATNLDATLVDVKKLAANLSSVVEQNKDKFNNIVKNVDSVLADNKVRVDNIMKNLESTSANFNEFSADIKQHPWKLLMKGKE